MIIDLIDILNDNYKLIFDIDCNKEEDFFKYICKESGNIIIKINDFNNFIINSIYENELEKIISKENNENKIYDIISENFEYMDLTCNPISRSLISLKIANVLIKYKWLRESSFIRMKIKNHVNRDIFLIYLEIIVNKLKLIKLLRVNKNKIIAKKNNISYYDFIFDYYIDL